ncbi:MAG: response regulator [Anaerolineae bacterium]|nr:response regulator [Anaerolineae bacterium]
MILTNPPIGTLLVIDEPTTLDTIKPWLENRKYDVHAAQGSADLPAQMQTLHPDLVLIGTRLPGENGFEICTRMKGDSKALGFVPILLLLESDSDELTGLDAGADDFLIKPIKESELLARVGALLRIKHQHDALWQENQKLTQELAKRNADLELALFESRAAAVLKDSIVQNVSHELRTPLVQVKGAVSLLAEDARAASPTGNSPLANMATQATAKLENIIQNITQLAISFNVKLEPFSLVDATSHAIRQLNRMWSSSAQVERIKTSLDNVPLVTGDRNGVAQVLQQLIDNAIKFSPEGGSVEVFGERQGDMVRIAVRDQGIGIQQDQITQIFQAFYQVERGTTRRFGGTGVGLAISKLILDSMNTTMTVESQPGAGSTFSFLLPVAQVGEIEHAQQEIVRTLKTLDAKVESALRKE